jgi:hypothetical protein
MNMQTSRRAVLTRAGQAGALAIISTTPATASTPAQAGIDPVLHLVAAREHQYKLFAAADERMAVIAVTLPKGSTRAPRPAEDNPHWGILARLRDHRFGDISREAIEQHIEHTRHFAELRDDPAAMAQHEAEAEALLAWWDSERSRMDKVLAESGYAAAKAEFDAAEKAWTDLESEIATAPATTLAGVIAKLGLAAEAVLDMYGDDLLDAPGYEACTVGALADLERLAAGGRA